MYLRIGLLGLTITLSLHLGAEQQRWIDNTSGQFDIYDEPEPEYEYEYDDESRFGFQTGQPNVRCSQPQPVH